MNSENPFAPPNRQARVPDDFQDRVLQRIRVDHQRKQMRIQTSVLCIAAVAAFGWHHYRQDPMELQIQPPSARVASAQNGVNWLLQAQNPDGSWSAESWGGHPRFSAGVSALATLALLNSPDPVEPAALEAAIATLEQQLASGIRQPNHGPQFYNLILNLHSLAEVQKQRPTAVRQRLLQQAYVHLLRNQQPDGGWGYADQNPLGYQTVSDANAAVTWWICNLLKSRPTFSLPGAEAALARGGQWLDRHIQSNGEIAYQTDKQLLAGPEAALFWMASPLPMLNKTSRPQTEDAYRDFFRAQTLPSEQLLQSLQAKQQQNGAWENPNDRWWQAGGKVYLTAMSVLTQVPKGGCGLAIAVLAKPPVNISSD
jgi:hypothetical protein